MKKGNIVSCVIVVFLLIFSVPTINSLLLPKMNTTDASESNNMIKVPRDSQKSIIHLYRFRKNGTIEKREKILTFQEKQGLMKKLLSIEDLEINLNELYSEKMRVLKEYELLDDESPLEDVNDLLGDSNMNFRNFTISQNEPFVAHFCPLFIGGGFGAGFGFRQLPIIRRIAGNIFSVGVIGLGVVLCLDLFEAVIHYQLTFTFPLLVHIIAGFVGIMLFAFDAVFPPIPGKPPVTLYSNIVAFGVAGLSVGLLLPS